MNGNENKALAILPANGWACDDCQADYKAGRAVWREVTEKFYDEMLKVLPPLDWRGSAFLVSEPYTHTVGNESVHCGLAKLGGRYFARYVRRGEFHALCRQLASHLAQEGGAA